MKKEINYLLVRILKGTASKEDLLAFSEWIKDYNNELYFERFKEMWHLYMHKSYVDKVSTEEQNLNLNKFIEYISASKRREKSKTIFNYSVSAAAVVLLIVGLFNFLGTPTRVGDETDISKLSYSDDSVKVELYNGKVVKSIKSIAGSVSDLTATLTIPEDKEVDKTIVYNSIRTPPGERAAMVLSDGSRVYLTSNSYLKYPTNFGSESRDVTLVGRAYFQVEKSDIPFRVNTADMNVEVLGTSFDVDSRTNGKNSSVIVVEGSVKIFAEGEVQMLRPDEQVCIDRITRKMEVKTVDSKLLTMWKDGVLIVHGESFKGLIESLASWYGVNIIDKTSLSEREKFNGRFDREDIEAAIQAVCISTKTQYRIVDGNLILEDIY